MEESLYSPGELIFKENEIDDFSLYYLVKGQVLILTKNSLEEET
jgi:CRP-like cAMP-binding protein